VLLDIEGTTTPIAFVHDTLFAFARARLDSHLRDHWASDETRAVVAQLAREHPDDAAEHADLPPWREDSEDALRASVTAYARWLMDRDRKSPGLKRLQGLMWEGGYRAGILRGQVWDDVPRAMQRWRKAGLRIAIYSSGSELAQRRLFESTAQGDLTPLITAYFDTGVGAKKDAASYRHIAERLACALHDICFVSDVVSELRAARVAGCATVLSLRPGNPPQEGAEEFAAVREFGEL